MSADCEHHWVIDTIDPTAGGHTARLVKFRCTDCPETLEKITARTDAEIAAELANASG